MKGSWMLSQAFKLVLVCIFSVVLWPVFLGFAQIFSSWRLDVLAGLIVGGLILLELNRCAGFFGVRLY